LTEELDEGEDIINPENNKYNKRFKMTKKMKKKRKEEKELERDMRMAEAEQNREDKKQNVRSGYFNAIRSFINNYFLF
jgi:hypothetical protein